MKPTIYVQNREMQMLRQGEKVTVVVYNARFPKGSIVSVQRHFGTGENCMDAVITDQAVFEMVGTESSKNMINLKPLGVSPR